MERSVTEQIEEDIVFGIYAPGTHLVEEPLQKRFGLSRYTLRAVMTELEQSGLVKKIPNRGVQVVEPCPDEIDELYAVRELLEVRAAELTPLPAEPWLLEELEALGNAHAAANKAGDMRAAFRLNVEFHRVQFQACPNCKLREAIKEYERKVHLVRAAAYGNPGHLDRVVAQHREIVAALASDDTARYAEAVRSHLPASTEAYRRAWMVKHGAKASGEIATASPADPWRTLDRTARTPAGGKSGAVKPRRHGGGSRSRLVTS